MRYQIMKQYIALQDGEPTDFQRNIWVAILPDGGDIHNDKEDIYKTKIKAEKDKKDKKEKDKEKKPNGKDKKDKFGKKIKNRKYKIIEIK